MAQSNHSAADPVANTINQSRVTARQDANRRIDQGIQAAAKAAGSRRSI